MNRNPPDAPDGSAEVRVVEASAGSGKTYALAKRYLRLVLRPGAAPEDAAGILAITFTNAAAREMKERILELLKKIALGAFPDREKEIEEDLVGALAADRRMLRARAHALVDYLVRNYNCFQVQTIDSFVNVLLSGCASELGLSAHFKIRNDSRDYLVYSLDRCIDVAHNDRRLMGFFQKFLHHYLLIEQGSGWSPKRGMFEVLHSLYRYGNCYGGEFAPSGISGEEMARRRNTLASLLAAARAAAPDGTDRRLLRALAGSVEGHMNGIDLGDMKSVYFRRDEFPMTGGRAAPPEVLALWAGVRGALAAIATDEARSAFDCYIDILDALLAQFRSRTRRDDLVFLEELNRRAAEIFDVRRMSVPEIYCRLAGRFRHFLIDEFQDTSALQWRNLHAMVEEALSTGGSLFYVGDKKQAIYRFRGGEVGLFEEVPRLFARFNVSRERLDENYRSGAQIVEFNNRLFSRENLMRFMNSCAPRGEDDDRWLTGREVDGVLDIFAGAQQKHRAQSRGGYVRVELLEYTEDEDRDDCVRPRLCALLREMVQRFPAEDIAILTRANDEVERVTAWLIAEGVRVESERTLNIRYHPHIKEILALLTFLNSPIDDLSFAAFILGDMFCRASGLARDELEAVIFSLRRGARSATGYLYQEFRARYPHVWDACLDRFFRGVGFVPLYELTVEILGTLGAFRHFPRSQGFFMRLLELIGEREKEDPGLGAFLRYIQRAPADDLFVSCPGSGAVRVMTIHRAKGLQFPAVIVPFIDLSRRALRPRGRGRGAAYAVQHEDDVLTLLKLDEKYTRFSTSVLDAFRAELKRTLIDELNIIYVACTRPRDELHLLIPCGGGADLNAARHLIPQDAMECGNRVERPRGGVRHGTPLVEIPPPEYGDWVTRLREERVDVGVVLRRGEIRRGEILHCMLSRVGNLEGADPERVLKEAGEQARALYPAVGEFSTFESVVRALAGSPQMRPFFFVPVGQVYQEKEIVNRDGRAGRIDRLVLRDGEAWVIDYKSSQWEIEGSRAQVREYMGMVGEAYPGLRVRGFLIFLDGLTAEEVHGTGYHL